MVLWRIPGGLMVGAALVLVAFGADAHEFWIEPTQFRLAPESEIVANLRYGENFKGDDLPYIPTRAIGGGVSSTAGETPLRSQIGDIPAFHQTTREQGLHVLSYHTVADRLTYTEPGKFAAFLEGKGLNWVMDRHRSRGLPETGFVEAYSRCAKALVQVGPLGGTDRPIGMPIELVAQANPYVLGAKDDPVLPVALLWREAPLADTQITVFRRQDALVIEKVRTDERGRAAISISAPGIYLLNAVHMIPGTEEPDDAWHSYWASMTFRIDPGP